MKILVFSDVHGSLNSLKELVKTQDWKCADMRICLGDICFGASRPDKCIKLLNKIDCVNIVGNNDLYCCDHIPEVDLPDFSQEKFEQLKFMQKYVSKAGKKIVLSWQKDLTLKLNNKTFYFTHYPWETLNGDENVIDTPKKKTLKTREKMFENIDADYIFFGHEHDENYFTNGKKHFYCVGTLGLKSPGNYLTVEIESDKITIENKYLSFDINKEIYLMNKAGYPYDKSKITKN